MRFVIRHLLVDIWLMIPIVRKCGVNISSCNVWKGVKDRIDRFPEPHVPDDNVRHSYAAADDPGPRTNSTIDDLNVRIGTQAAALTLCVQERLSAKTRTTLSRQVHLAPLRRYQNVEANVATNAIRVRHVSRRTTARMSVNRYNLANHSSLTTPGISAIVATPQTGVFGAYRCLPHGWCFAVKMRLAAVRE
jgi:hypothetical protein